MMPYSKFTLSKALIQRDRFFPEVSPVNPSPFQDTLKETETEIEIFV